MAAITLTCVARARDCKGRSPKPSRCNCPSRSSNTASSATPTRLAIFCARGKRISALTTPGQAGPASRSVGGPLAILINYYYIVRASLMYAVWFTGFLNVNLGILNMLPIPVLDGGHILFSLWEMVFRRAPNARVVTVTTNAFAILLIGVFVLLTGRDIWRFTPAKKYWDKLNGGAQTSVTETAVTNAPPK